MASVEKIGGWHICTEQIHYNANTASLLPIYPTLISTYRTMIFNGDVDGCVPFIGNEVHISTVETVSHSHLRAFLASMRSGHPHRDLYIIMVYCAESLPKAIPLNEIYMYYQNLIITIALLLAYEYIFLLPSNGLLVLGSK